MIPCSPHSAFCDAADEGAALGLLGLMTGLSEEHWCAGWITGLEFALWEVPAGRRFGMGVVTKRQSLLLKLLSEECRGWWHWQDDGARFIRRADWIERVAEEKAAAVEVEEQVRGIKPKEQS